VGLYEIEIEKIEHTITQGSQRFTWFGLMPSSMDGFKEKVLLRNNYNGSTKAISQNPNPKYTQQNSHSQLAHHKKPNMRKA
jgi:hypothetical protein